MTHIITILTSGTRGDLQPYIALGRRLQRAGYSVRIATHVEFAAFVRLHGLDFARVEGNPNELLSAPAYQSALTYNGSVLRSFMATVRYLRAVRPQFERMLASAWQVCRSTDALLVTLPTTWGQSIAERLGAPCMWALLQPLTRTHAFPSAFQPWRGSLGARYNWLSHRAVEQLMWQPWRTAINRWRRHTLNLPPLPLAGPWERIYADQTPFVYGVSAQVVPPPFDWPATHALTGFWYLERQTQWQPPPTLYEFLTAGSPPVYVGFGSMSAGRIARLAPLISAALQRCGLRGVLQIDSYERAAIALPPTIYACDPLPHDWLFPYMAAVVQHGGAGTTAASLRAGVPTVVVPFGVDQYFWGARVAALGAGPDPIPARALCVERLAQALQSATTDPGIRTRAAELGARLRHENGVEQATALIDRFVHHS